MQRNRNTGALDYHEAFPPGKLEIAPTKPMSSQDDLSLAYSPGVADPCMEIVSDAKAAQKYTARGNLVGVVTNGTAVLGLGNIGALASKPVMEGKAVLFKKFADINAFDIEIDQSKVEEFCNIVASLEPTFGGINLEDIKAPECFEIEENLKARMKIPVFHDDQHGTAIVVAAAVLNGLIISNKNIEDAKIVVNGAGAAAIACLNLLVGFGAEMENIVLCDSMGPVDSSRRVENLHQTKLKYQTRNSYKSLANALIDADVFLGLSVAGAVSQDMVKTMADTPLVFAMANPDPEILPEDILSVRPDALVATGRSDYPNQVNNVLCFPFIFRGALDVGATSINDDMKKACAIALAELAREPVHQDVVEAYQGRPIEFGPNYLIPKPQDPRLRTIVAAAVAKAACQSGVANVEHLSRSKTEYSK